MESTPGHEELEEALRRSGSTWNVALAHGLLCSRLAVEGIVAGVGWIDQVLEDAPPDDERRREAEELLDRLFDSSYRQLGERRSEFELLLPDEGEPAERRTEALALWCEGFLHGLVTGNQDPEIRARLAAEPLAGLIKDMLQITRAGVDVDDDAETNEAAYAELVEYVRVAAQLAFEELAPFRAPLGASENAPSGGVH